MKICGFHNEYDFLSNFVMARIFYDGAWYSSVEHAYQAAKTLNCTKRELIGMAKTPGIAKRLGRVDREDWLEVREPIMLELLREKFKIAHYREQLLATGDAHLEETNWWKDTYWGVYEGIGQNRLGYLLMQIRDDLKSLDNR